MLRWLLKEKLNLKAFVISITYNINKDFDDENIFSCK